MGVASQLNAPWKYDHADCEGSMVTCLSKFKVSSACGSKRSHKFLRKSGATPARIERKCALNVRIARSAALLRCVCGGTN